MWKRSDDHAIRQPQSVCRSSRSALTITERARHRGGPRRLSRPRPPLITTDSDSTLQSAIPFSLPHSHRSFFVLTVPPPRESFLLMEYSLRYRCDKCLRRSRSSLSIQLVVAVISAFLTRSRCSSTLSASLLFLLLPQQKLVRGNEWRHEVLINTMLALLT